MTYSHTIPLEIQISSDSLKGRTKHEKLAHGYPGYGRLKTRTYSVGREVEQFFHKTDQPLYILIGSSLVFLWIPLAF